MNAGVYDSNLRFGWFLGFLESGERRWRFAMLSARQVVNLIKTLSPHEMVLPGQYAVLV